MPELLEQAQKCLILCQGGWRTEPNLPNMPIRVVLIKTQDERFVTALEYYGVPEWDEEHSFSNVKLQDAATDYFNRKQELDKRTIRCVRKHFN